MNLKKNYKDLEIINKGWLHRYAVGVFLKEWKSSYFRLRGDGLLEWFNDEGDCMRKGSCQLQTSVSHIIMGVSPREYYRQPTVPRTFKERNLIGLRGNNKSDSSIFWLLCFGDEDFREWRHAIGITLSRLIKDSFLGEFFQPLASSSTDSSGYTTSPDASPIMPYNQQWIQTKLQHYRNTNACESVYMTISTDREVHVYYPPRNTWFFIMKCRDWFNNGSMVCSTRNGIIIAGGDSIHSGNQAVIIDVCSMSMDVMPKLPLSTRAASMVCCQEYVYVVGGTKWKDGEWSKSGDIYKLSLTAAAWKHNPYWQLVSALDRAVSRPLLAVLSSKLYIIGGVDSSGKSCMNAQTYDTRTNELMTIPQAALPCSGMNGSMVIRNSHVLIITPNVAMELKASSWNVKHYKKQCDTLKAFQLPGQPEITCCVHQKTSPNLQCTLRTYNHESNKWIRSDFPVMKNTYPYYFLMFNH